LHFPVQCPSDREQKDSQMMPSSLASPASARRGPPNDLNVLFVVLDDVGVEWFSGYGVGQRFCTDPEFQYARTPVFDDLAANGLMFVDAYANPVCGPTRACFQTGQYAMRTGFGENIRDPDTSAVTGHRLSDALPWLPRAIEQSRPGVYDKAMIGKWHMCDGYSSVVGPNPFPSPDANLDHAVAAGYDYSAIHIPNYGCAYTWYRIVNGSVTPTQGLIGPPYTTASWSPTVHLADAAAWIASRTKPWYLQLAFNPPHVPMAVPPFETLSAATIAELQAAELAPGSSFPASANYPIIKLVWRAANESVDWCIGQLLAGMTAQTRANTVVIVMGDNGTVANAIPPGFPHTKRDVYRGGTQVPLVVSGPNVVEPGRLPIDMIHAVDVYSTILDIVAGKPTPTTADCDGISFLPVLQNQPGKRRRLYTEAFGPWGTTDQTQMTARQRSIYDGRWRYVVRQGLAQLFDNHTDFLEVNDVISANLEVAAQFARELDELAGS
jgi:arylsulfatase B